MRIYIPTRGRPRQRTVERLGQSICDKYKLTLVCPPNEVRELSEYSVAVQGCRKEGIAATRQWILDNTDDPVVLMLDDDLPTWCHRLRDTNKYAKATEVQIYEHLRLFAGMMEQFAHGSIGHRLFCQEKPPLYYNSRMLRALAYNLDLTDGAQFRLKVMEDFDMALQLFAKGRDAIVYNAMVQDQYNNNSDGGCSSYRTPEVQAAAAERLAKLWPDVVTVVKRAPKREWVGFGGERTDVRVNWAKAAKLGGCSK